MGFTHFDEKGKAIMVDVTESTQWGKQPPQERSR
mgnify:CR=1 FL=1